MKRDGHADPRALHGGWASRGGRFALMAVRAAGLPRRLAAALRMVHRLHHRPQMEPGEALRWATQLRWYEDYLRLTQSRDEILWLLEILRTERPQTVVEIGTDQGGTLFLWPYVAAEDALIVGIDLRPLGGLGRWSPYALVRRAFALWNQRIELLMPADTHDPRTVERLQRIIRDRKIDFLFIDGDHSYPGVKGDFELFSPLVRGSGIVAFHDISGDVWPGAARFFAELAPGYEHGSRIASVGERYGIGFVRLPE